MKVRCAALAVSLAVGVAQVLLLSPAASGHATTLTAGVGAKASGTSDPQAHVAGDAGHWCAMLTAISGTVGTWWLDIRNGAGDVVASIRGWHPSSSRLAGVSCSSSPIDAGAYSATLEVRGGRQGSSMSVELHHP